MSQARYLSSGLYAGSVCDTSNPANDCGYDTWKAIDIVNVGIVPNQTNTVNVTDGTTVFVTAQDVKSVGSETVANVPKFYATGGTITASLAQTGAATAGLVIVEISYVQEGVSLRIQE